jgi:hypothetical protein
MTIRQAIRRIGAQPELLQNASLSSETRLEDMIVATPSILHDPWTLIGRQADKASAAGWTCWPWRSTRAGGDRNEARPHAARRGVNRLGVPTPIGALNG